MTFHPTHPHSLCAGESDCGGRDYVQSGVNVHDCVTRDERERLQAYLRLRRVRRLFQTFLLIRLNG
jgi:hypothetical protein